MDISIIIATYNRENILRKTLDSFKELNTEALKWEVLVVDNAQQDSVRSMVGQYGSSIPVKYISHEINGKNSAVNKAIEIAQGSLIVLTDDDVVADKSWLWELHNGSKKWPNAGVFGGRVLPLWPVNADTSFTKNLEKDFYTTAFAVADWKIKEGFYPAGQVWGPNMAVRKEIFDRGYRFNTSIGPGGETYVMGSETEFTKRLEKDGVKSVYLPKALVYHQIREEQLSVDWLCRRAFNYGRSDVFHEKNEEAVELFGAPRYMYKLCFLYSLKEMRAKVLFNSQQALKWGIKRAFIQGQMYQYRENKLKQKNIETPVFKRNIEKSPKVSVIIATYNRAHLVSGTVDSVLNQTYPNVEVIVVDDGSKDNTLEVLKSYGDKIKVLTQENKGNSAARNNGLLYASGEYVSFLDDDDKWLDDMLAESVHVLEKNKNLGFVYTGTYLVDENSNVFDKRTIWEGENTTFDRLYEGNIIISPSVALIRRESVDAVGGFDEQLRQSSDYDLWLRLAKKYPFSYLDKVLVEYKIHPSNLSRNLDTRLKNHLKILKKYEICKGRTWWQRHIRAVKEYYHIATLCKQQEEFRKAGWYYFNAVIRYPFIGLLYWPKEIQHLRFTFFYRIIKVYATLFNCFFKSIFNKNTVHIK